MMPLSMMAKFVMDTITGPANTTACYVTSTWYSYFLNLEFDSKAVMPTLKALENYKWHCCKCFPTVIVLGKLKIPFIIHLLEAVFWHC